MEFVKMPFCKKLTPEETSYLKSLCTGMDRQLEVVAENLSSEQFKELAYMNQQQIDAFFKNSGIQQKLNDLIEYNAHDSEEFIQQFYKIGAELGYNDLGAILAYTTADATALQTLTTYNFELVRNLNQGLEQGIRECIFNSVASGEGYLTTMRKLQELPLEPLPVYDEFGEVKYMISPRARAEMIARTEHARAVNTGTLQAYANYGVDMVEIITARDDLVCEICEEYDNDNPHSLTEAQSLLPAHPNSYHKDTQVFTEEGWKFIRELNGTEKLLSLNPKNESLEFIKPVQLIKHKESELIHIYNKWFDVCVTPDHDCFIHQRKMVDGVKGCYPEFRKPSELNSESRFVRCIDIDRENPKVIDINGLKFEPSDFAFFMAWYISEGSVLHDEENSKKRGYPVYIAQQISENREIIQPVIENICNYLGLRLNITKNSFVIYSKELYDYLLPLGYSYEKYIPSEVFTLNKECLNIFLDNYVRGDGHERTHGKYNSVERTVFTSSQRLRDDLSYLILLCGYCPSISVHSKKGTVVEHRNGTYTQNYDIYGIRINSSKYATYEKCNVETIPYDDYVYCVELPKWHTLWVMRNGKTSWNGNCRCSYAPYIPDPPSAEELGLVDNPEVVDLTESF